MNLFANLEKAWHFDRIYRIYRMLTLRYILLILSNNFEIPLRFEVDTGFTQIGGLLPFYFTAKSAKIAKDSVGLALRTLRPLRCIIT